MSHRSALIALVFAASLGLAAMSAGCDKKQKVVVESSDEQIKPARGKSESQLREEYEARQKARENAPEPELDPKDPREKLELIWNRGKKRLGTIYNERADQADALQKRLNKLSTKKGTAGAKARKELQPLFKPLFEFGIGKTPEELEKAPKEICAIINKVRGPAEAAINENEKIVASLSAQLEELDELQDTGGTVYQRQFDKLEEAKLMHSSPVLAGRQIFMFVRNILYEAEVLAEWGARRTQLELGKCLGEIAAKGEFPFELAQEQLEKVIARTKYYRKENY